jgi:uncharacterized protein (UPF0335 family)
MAKTLNEEARAQNNKINPAMLKKWIGQFDILAKEDLDLHMGYMADKKSIKEERKELFKSAKVEGLPTKEFKAILERRDLGERIRELESELDLDQRATYTQMIEALGGEKALVGLPLGDAALKTAKPDEPKPDPAKVGKENGEKVAVGIKELKPKKGDKDKSVQPSAPADEEDEEDLRPRHLREGDKDASAKLN